MNKVLVIFLSLVIFAGIGIGSTAAQDINATVGDNNTVLSPSQNQTQDQAQGQAQTQNSTNNNNLTNDNNNTANSNSSANNHINIINSNTFNPIVVISSRNGIGDIRVGSFNANLQLQAAGVKSLAFGEGTLEFAAGEGGNVPLVMATIPKNASAAGQEDGGVGMQPTGLNATSLLMGIVGVLGGLLASRFRS